MKIPDVVIASYTARRQALLGAEIEVRHGGLVRRDTPAS
jgi:hypothetical protein